MERTSFLQKDEKRKKNNEEDKGWRRGRQGTGKKTEEESVETGSNQMTISKSSLFRAFYSKGGGHHPLVSESKAGIFTVEKREFRCALTRGCGHEEAASSLT